MPQMVPDSAFRMYRWIVAPTLAGGTHTSIQAAINDASAGDTVFIRTGTYTENITLKAGVNIAAYPAAFILPITTQKIIGTLTHNTAGECAVVGISLETNGAACISVSGSNLSRLFLKDCSIQATNATAISFTCTNATSLIEMLYCSADLSAGFAVFDHSGAGDMVITYSQLRNSGNSTTPNTISSGRVFINYCQVLNRCVASGTGQFGAANCSLSGDPVFTSTSSSVCSLTASSLNPGTGTALSIGAGSTVRADRCIFNGNIGSINSTGAGTLFYDEPSFNDLNDRKFATTTNTCANSGTYTPVLTFGGGSTGITYSSQVGIWTRNNNIITFSARIVLTSKGTSTGTAAVSLPPFAANTGYSTNLNVSSSNVTYASYLLAIPTTATTMQINSQASPATSVGLTDAAFANNSFIGITGSYFTTN